MQIRVKVSTETKKEFVTELSDGRYHVGVHAKREQGQANERARELLATHFHLPVEHVLLWSGHNRSSKVFSLKKKEYNDRQHEHLSS